MSTSMPCSDGPAATVTASSSQRTRAPMRSRTSTKRDVALQRRRGADPRTVTAPPVTTAAAQAYDAAEASGSTA